MIGIQGKNLVSSEDTIVLKNEQQLDQIVDEYQKIMTENKIGTFEELSRDVETKLNFSSNWHILKDPEAVCFYQLKSKHHRVYFATKVFVNQDLVVKIILKDCELPADGQRLQYWLQLEKILSQFDLGCDLELKAPYCMNRAWEFLSKINEASLDIENNLQLNFLKVN